MEDKTKQNYMFRFSYDKYFGRFGLSEFKEIGEQLENIIKSSRNLVDSTVFICEDIHTYNRTNISPINRSFFNIRKEALKQRKKYPLFELNNGVWKRSYKSELIIRLPESKDNFMFCLTNDNNEANRLCFYGQDIDEANYNAILNKFNKRGILYRLGDGFSKISDFSMGIGMIELSGSSRSLL
jgi:hypothetical protein